MGDYFKQSEALLKASRAPAPMYVTPMPRIAINGRFLTRKILGVQRFAVETVRAIDALLETDPYRALKERLEIVAPKNARDFQLKNIPLRRVGLFSGYAWEQLELPLYAAGRTLLNLCMLGPILMRRQIVVVHDATVQALPDNFSFAFRAAYGFIIPRLCAGANVVITVSEFSRREIGKWYGAEIDAMPVCHEGGDHITAKAPDPAVLERFGLRGKRFLLGVGVGSKNKNIETVLAAFRQANLGDTLLVLTGKRDRSVHGPIADIQSDNVRNVGYVSDQELRTLYENAIALVFPSRYEGFGLPALEAMTCGCPVVISDQPALVEVCGNAALRCGTDNVMALADHLRVLNSDILLRERLAAAGSERARHFTWARTARALLDQCLNVGVRQVDGL